MTYDEVMEEINASIHDAMGDNPDVNPDDVSHDIIVSRFYDNEIPKAVKQELARCALGWFRPEDDDLYRLHGIA